MPSTNQVDSNGAKKKMPENDDDHDPGAYYMDEREERRTESISITVPESSCESEKTLNDLQYRATDMPHWKEAIFLGFQQTMVCISGILVIPHLVSQVACAGLATIALRVQLISTTLVVTGLTTLIQTTLGLRLAILQGPSFAFIPPLFAFNDLPGMECKSTIHDEVPEESVLYRIQTIQGSLAGAALMLIFVGATGLIGIIARRTGPVTICPLMVLLCLGNAPLILEKSGTHWISIIQFAVLCCFALFLAETQVPLPYIDLKGIHFVRYRLFGQFPYLISIVLTWLFALFLTVTNIEKPEGPARVDQNMSMSVLVGSPIFQVPYPGQFGFPRFSLGLFLGMLASCVACSVESLGAYGVLARVSQEKPPPSSTLNRAIVVEGVGCFLAGLMGCGVGVTTYSENVAVVSLTRVASRYTMQIAGVMLIFLGIFTKFGAVLATIPDPIVGGTLGMGVCMICGLAFSNLRTVDLTLTRNLTIVGLAIIMGVVIPDYAKGHPVDVGVDEIDQMLNILLQIKMFIGGLLAFVLDNIVPGATREQRGFEDCHETVNENGETGRYDDCGTAQDGYSFGKQINDFILRNRVVHKLPFMPSKPRLQATVSKQDIGPVPQKTNLAAA